MFTLLLSSPDIANHPGKGPRPLQSQSDCWDFQNRKLTPPGWLGATSGSPLRPEREALCENRAEALKAEPGNREKLNSNQSLKPVLPQKCRATGGLRCVGFSLADMVLHNSHFCFYDYRISTDPLLCSYFFPLCSDNISAILWHASHTFTPLLLSSPSETMCGPFPRLLLQLGKLVDTLPTLPALLPLRDSAPRSLPREAPVPASLPASAPRSIRGWGQVSQRQRGDLPCSRPCRRWVSPRDRRCPLRRHSRRAVHPEPDAAEAAAGAGVGAGAAVTAPGRLLQPPGSGGWAPGAEKLPPHPSPSSHSLEGKTKAERRLGSGARRWLSCPRHAWLAEEGPPLARPPSRQPSPARPAARLAAGLGTGGAGPWSASSGGCASSEWWPSGAPGSPAKPSASRRRRRLPAARPARGRPGIRSQPGLQILGAFQPLRGPLGVSPPLRLGTKLLEEQSRLRDLQAKLTGEGPVRSAWAPPSLPPEAARAPGSPLPRAQSIPALPWPQAALSAEGEDQKAVAEARRQSTYPRLHRVAGGTRKGPDSLLCMNRTTLGPSGKAQAGSQCRAGEENREDPRSKWFQQQLGLSPQTSPGASKPPAAAPHSLPCESSRGRLCSTPQPDIARAQPHVGTRIG
ncbi:unnamed protein product [Rangifer tarandus platyrhynchus]|uniref:Uncharacterized protein n=2 Tax=Rangifer tarandus platyrhynchus TaxID=3082113 RepID=A0ABN8YHU3_RANTA|nr:unnamed protein product [Rangifer tarandus platyrhynchus]